MAARLMVCIALGKALDCDLSRRAWQLLVWMLVVLEKVWEAVGKDW